MHLEVIDAPVPGPRDWRGRYDAIVSVEKLEVLGEGDRVRYVRALDRLLTIGVSRRCRPSPPPMR